MQAWIYLCRMNPLGITPVTQLVSAAVLVLRHKVKNNSVGLGLYVQNESSGMNPPV